MSNIIRIPFFMVVALATTTVITLIIALMTIKMRTVSLAFLSAALLFTGCLLFQVRQILPADHIKNFTGPEPKEVYVEGIVVDEPIAGETFYGGRKVILTLEAGRLQEEGIKHEVTGRVKVSLTGEPRQSETNTPSYGDRILVNCRQFRL